MSIKIGVYSWFTVTSNECNVSPYRIGEFSSVPRTRIQTIELNNEARVYSARDSAWIKDIHFKDRCKADPLNSSDKCEQRDLFRIARRRSFSKLYFPFVIYLLLGPLVSTAARNTWEQLSPIILRVFPGPASSLERAVTRVTSSVRARWDFRAHHSEILLNPLGS